MLDALGKGLKDNANNADGTVSGLGRLENAFIRLGNAGKYALNFLGFIGRNVLRLDVPNLKLTDTIGKQADAEIKLTRERALQQDKLKSGARAVVAFDKSLMDTTSTTKGLTKKQEDLRVGLRSGLAKSLADAKEKLRDAKSAMKEFSNGIRDALTSTVSLADAMSKSNDTEDAYKTALQERAQAYKDLDQAKVSRDATQYAEALAKVADADLMGHPWQIIVGPRSAANRRVELKRRATGEREEMAVEDALAKILP